MPISSNLPRLTGYGREIGDQSDASDTLLVPWGPAFSIWFVIFFGIAAFASYQFGPDQRERPIFRAMGWQAAGAFWLIAAWGIAASYLPLEVSRIVTALIFVPAVVLICKAVVVLSLVDKSDTSFWLSDMPLGLLAGWCSLAVFLNWAQLFVNGPLAIPLPETVIAVAVLLGALAWIIFQLKENGGNLAFAFAALWGLLFLAYARLYVDDFSTLIVTLAIIGFLVVAGAALFSRIKSA